MDNITQSDNKLVMLTRMLEFLIILDKKYYLEENGFQVELFKLCDSVVSPRNIGISFTID
jgi:hypothetical protein